MLFEMTLLATFVLHHFLFTCCLLLALTLVFRLINTSAEMQSWLWVCAFIIANTYRIAVGSTNKTRG